MIGVMAVDAYVNIGRWFSILYRRSQQFIVEACQELGLTYSEFVLLVRLYDHEGAKQDELAAMLLLDKAVVTRTVNSLEKKGYLVRQQDEKDKRVRHVYLTKLGQERYTFLRNVIQCWADYLCEEMPEDTGHIVFEAFEQLTARACEANLAKIAKNVPKGEMPIGRK